MESDHFTYGEKGDQLAGEIDIVQFCFQLWVVVLTALDPFKPGPKG